MSAQNLVPDELAARAAAIYDRKLKPILEATHADQFVVIEPDSGDYFLGRTMTEAIDAAQAAHPDRRGFVMRVGRQSALHIGSFDR